MAGTDSDPSYHLPNKPASVTDQSLLQLQGAQEELHHVMPPPAAPLNNDIPATLDKIVVWASGNKAHAQNPKACQHGIDYEPVVIKRLSKAFGVQLFEVSDVLDLRLTPNITVRVIPDGSNKPNVLESEIILEVKCPYSRKMRSRIADRMELHARQCCFELLASPNAKYLIFAAVASKPVDQGGKGGIQNTDFKRLHRQAALDALTEIQANGLVEDFATEKSNDKITSILARMLTKASLLPKLSNLKVEIAMSILPDLFSHVPEHLREWIAHDVRRDRYVESDCMTLASCSQDTVVGTLNMKEFPKYYLRYSGRIAFYHFCLQSMPLKAEELLHRCCFKDGDVSAIKFKHGQLMRKNNLSLNTHVQLIFQQATQDQNQPEAASSSSSQAKPVKRRRT